MSQIAMLGGGSVKPDAETLTGDTGGAVGCDAAFNINILGGAGVTVDGTPGTNTLEVNAPGVAQDNVLYVGKYGTDANSGRTLDLAKLTIQSAVTAANDGDTIIVFPGTYTETITHADNNVTLIAQGKPNTCIITQADANVIDFSTFTGIQYKYFGINCTAATTAICTIKGSTGFCSFKECQLSMATTADIAAVTQPFVACLSGAGTIVQTFGKTSYKHTGNGGATALKGVFGVADGSHIELVEIDEIEIVNSGTALASSVCIDQSTTGYFDIRSCHISLTDPDATILAGFGYFGGTGTQHEFYKNVMHITATNNAAYGIFVGDTASTTRTFFNHIQVNDTAGSSYAYNVGATATLISTFDDIVAADGNAVAATGSLYEVNKPIRGNLICSGPTASGDRSLTVANTDNTATISDAAVNVSVGGSTSIGDPYTNYLVTGAGTYSVGIDNSDSDEFKITTGATPSAGTELFTMTNAGVITLANDLDVTEGGTGLSTLTSHGILTGNGTGDVIVTAEPSNGQVLIGSTGNTPVLSTLTAGTNISVTEAAGSITIANTAPGGALVWESKGASGAFVNGTGYLCNSGAALSFSLPATAAVGTEIAVSLCGATSWEITQGANQYIMFGSSTSTVGVGGSLESTETGDTLHLVAMEANLGWVVVSSIGNISIT